MPFTENQKTIFCSALEKKGWSQTVGKIDSPSGCLWFLESHFIENSPAQLADTFKQRALRIEAAKVGAWEQSTAENKDVYETLQEQGIV